MLHLLRMYKIPELLPVNTGCQDLLTGVTVPDGFVGDEPYPVQEFTPYKVTTIRINSACKEQSRLI